MTIAGFAAGAERISGVTASAGMIKIENNGKYQGLAVSAFNHIKGEQVGLSLGILNYAYRLHGVQIGLINYVKENPVLFRYMPLINFNFSGK